MHSGLCLGKENHSELVFGNEPRPISILVFVQLFRIGQIGGFFVALQSPASKYYLPEIIAEL